mmetsp:Transcript_41358/g.104285  ORF Transcript_41358/g.104285 Transcript_41358/m.104285 type:complete len:198 (-) Transcript_41358:2096-2689(-)
MARATLRTEREKGAGRGRYRRGRKQRRHRLPVGSRSAVVHREAMLPTCTSTVTSAWTSASTYSRCGGAGSGTGVRLSAVVPGPHPSLCFSQLVRRLAVATYRRYGHRFSTARISSFALRRASDLYLGRSSTAAAVSDSVSRHHSRGTIQMMSADIRESSIHHHQQQQQQRDPHQHDPHPYHGSAFASSSSRITTRQW